MRWGPSPFALFISITWIWTSLLIANYILGKKTTQIKKEQSHQVLNFSLIKTKGKALYYQEWSQRRMICQRLDLYLITIGLTCAFLCLFIEPQQYIYHFALGSLILLQTALTIILFIIKNFFPMKQKYTYQDNCFFEGFRDAQPIGSKRSSLNIPDCSAVTDNQNNCYLTETNEISWLEKFAQDNEKVCDSGLFEENLAASSKGQHVVNEMKFSFNMNYHTDAKQKQDHIFGERDNRMWELNSGKGFLQMEEEYQSKKMRKDECRVLGEIQNNDNVNRARTRKESIAGSIKKNQKARPAQQEITDYQRQIAECTPFSKLEEMNDKLSKALRNDLKPAPIGKQNIKREDKAKQPQSSCSSPFLVAKMYKDKFENNELYFQRINQMNKVKTIDQPKFFQEPITQYEQKPTINTSCNQNTAFQALFNKLDLSQTGKLSKDNCSTASIPEDFKLIFGNLLTRIKFKQLVCNKRQFVKLCEITVEQYNSAQINELLKTLSPSSTQQMIKKDFSSMKNAEKPQKSYRLDTFEAVDYKRGLSSIENGANYRSTAASLKKNTTIDMPASKKSLYFNDSSQTSPFRCKKSTIQKDIFDSFNESSSYKKRNASVSQLTLEQHKKSLENLNMLNKRMQSCLSTNILSQHSKSPYSRQKSLNFDELVKHV